MWRWGIESVQLAPLLVDITFPVARQGVDAYGLHEDGHRNTNRDPNENRTRTKREPTTNHQPLTRKDDAEKSGSKTATNKHEVKRRLKHAQ